MKKLLIVFLIFIFLIFIFIFYGFYSGLKITNYTYRDKELPMEFDGYRIAFISDLHGKEVGRGQYKLIRAVKSTSPDVVVFTGDMIDGDNIDISSIKDLLEGLSGQYPMYAITGNHEKDNSLKYEELLQYYEQYGVNFLDDDYQLITRDGSHIGIYGISYRDRYYIKKGIHSPNKDINSFNILLYHDANVFPYISQYGYNLILSGHTHGGIVRLPFVGGIINNDGSFFPEYDGGVFALDDTSMIVNRGIGDSRFPRFYNRPEVVCITLKTEGN